MLCEVCAGKDPAQCDEESPVHIFCLFPPEIFLAAPVSVLTADSLEALLSVNRKAKSLNLNQ